MRLKLRHTLVLPIGGHHFIEDGVMLKGDTLPDVVKALSDYRLTNMVPIGEPEQEILQYYMRNWPYMVDEDYDYKITDAKVSPNSRWVKWIRMNWGKPLGKMATAREANSRAAICCKCPYNLPIEPINQEEQEMMRKAFMMRRGHDVPKNLGFCSLHLWDNGSSIFIEAPSNVSGLEKDAARYVGCWVA